MNSGEAEGHGELVLSVDGEVRIARMMWCMDTQVHCLKRRVGRPRVAVDDDDTVIQKEDDVTSSRIVTFSATLSQGLLVTAVGKRCPTQPRRPLRPPHRHPPR